MCGDLSAGTVVQEMAEMAEKDDTLNAMRYAKSVSSRWEDKQSKQTSSWAEKAAPWEVISAP